MSNKKKRILWGIIFVLIATLFIVVIPIIINEAYKCNRGYKTVWNAADVLSYYGNIISAVVAIVTLSITILFTRMQIRRDSYIKNETEKWQKIEMDFGNAITAIHPIQTLKEIMDCGFTDPNKSIIILRKYQMTCELSTDQLNMYLSIIDYPKVKDLVLAIQNISKELSDGAQSEIEIYSRVHNLIAAKTAQDTLDLEIRHPHSFPPDTISFCNKTVKNAEGESLEELEKLINQSNVKMVALYKTTYKSILQLKSSTFETINAEIQQAADRMLHIWRSP